MQYAMEPIGAPGYASDNDTVADSMNLLHMEGQNWNQLQDGTIEVTDRQPKKEYYMSLRRFNNNANTLYPLGSVSSGSGIGLANGSSTVHPLNSSLRPNGETLRKGLQASTDFKPSGKMVDCTVITLDGRSKEFRIDKAAYGQHVFDSVCDHLSILEPDFFGLTYYDSNNPFWLQLDQKISKQLGKNEWQFDFQVKFYPYDMDMIKEHLTRYYLCLQVRQDIVSGQLPCSFLTYCLLGSYIIQSEAGDHDPWHHQGVKYIQGQQFAPSMLQTPEMLEKIVELHKMHRGKSPEEADHIFLSNARKLALYGVALNKVKTSEGKDLTLGVYHGGILLYRNRIRLMRISWPSIISLSHKGNNFVIFLRPCLDSSSQRNMSFKCISSSLAKHLYNICVDHHAFFRLRGAKRPKKPSLFPSFPARKYHYPGSTINAESDTSLLNNRTLSKFRPMPARPNEAGWFTLARGPNVDHMNGNIASQYQYQPAMAGGSGSGLNPMCLDNRQMMNGKSVSATPGTQRYYMPVNNGGLNEMGYPNPLERPKFDIEHWRISPVDCTPSLGIDHLGLRVSANQGCGWQGCRANKGIKAPGAYYYEAVCLDAGLVRVGWSTNDADLELGKDNCGFGFGSDLNGNTVDGVFGRSMHRNVANDYAIPVQNGDVIGCLLDLDKGSVSWSCNGKCFQRAFTIPDQLRAESFLPAASLKDSQLLFNFGEKPFDYAPGGSFVPVALSHDDNQVPNRFPGWRMNQYDATQGVDVAPDGSIVQSHIGLGWQGCRANQGIRGLGRFYFEVTPTESCGLWRIGLSTDDGELILGTDHCSFGYGADPDGFGLNGQQGKRMHNNEIENYGEAFTKDDVISCFVDTIERTIKWSKNGFDLGVGYQIPPDLINPKSATALYPTVSLIDSTIEMNFGEKPLKFYPGPDWIPICSAPIDCTKRSKRKGPERKVKGWSYIDPCFLESSLRQQHMQLGQAAANIAASRAIDRQEDDVTSKAGLNASNQTSKDLAHSTPNSSKVDGLSELNGKQHFPVSHTNPISPPPGGVAMPGMMAGRHGNNNNINKTTPNNGHANLQVSSMNSTIYSEENVRHSSVLLKTSFQSHRVQNGDTSNEPDMLQSKPNSNKVDGLSELNGKQERFPVSHTNPISPPPGGVAMPGMMAGRHGNNNINKTTPNNGHANLSASSMNSTIYSEENVKVSYKNGIHSHHVQNGDTVVINDEKNLDFLNEYDQALNAALLEVTKLDRDVSVLSQVEISTKPDSFV